MVCFISLAFAATSIFGLAAAVPTNLPPKTGVIHRITVGSQTANGGLSMEPENVVAEVGDLIEFRFMPKNHSIVQSSFDEPCKPLTGGVFSGFNFPIDAGEANKTFTFTVKDKEPFWYYCSQKNGDHCNKGMVGVINQNFNSATNTLAKYKESAKKAEIQDASADPEAFQGGELKKNYPL